MRWNVTLRGLRPIGIALEVKREAAGNGFAAKTSGPGYEAARATLSAAWGSETVRFFGDTPDDGKTEDERRADRSHDGTWASV